METTVGQRIKKVLFDHDLNSAKLADRIGMTRQSVGQMINGITKVSMALLVGIAKECPRADIRWILTGEHTEGLWITEEQEMVYYPLKEKDKQINELHEMIKKLLTKIPEGK